MYYTLKEACMVLKRNNFLYKDKTVTLRTIKTMADNGLFLTLRFCECGKCYLVHKPEVNRMARGEN